MTKAQDNALNKINEILQTVPRDSPDIPQEIMEKVDTILGSLSRREEKSLRAYMLILMEAVMRMKTAENN